MLVCVDCKREMTCVTCGVGLDWGQGHVYPSDVYKCKGCGKKVAYSEGRSNFEPKYKSRVGYVRMNEHAEKSAGKTY